jgi:DNA-binding CsgD family transcriptional regulator
MSDHQRRRAAAQRGATEELTEGISVRGDSARVALLLERERELEELDALLRDAAQGNGRVVLVQGAAGIGKTRLLGETCSRAAGLGFEVLSARGGELEREFGFGIVRQLLEGPLSRADESLRAELLAGAAELAETVLSRSPRSAIAVADTTGSVLHGLYWLVANLAERSPLLLAIDDLHWADGPSVRFLVYLARRLEGLPVALAVATRTSEPAAAPQLVQALELEAPPPVLRPGRLTDEGVAALVRDGLGDDAADELCAACADATGGNPFLLSELLADLSFDRASADPIDAEAIRRRVPERVSASLLLRVGRLGYHAPELARAVAVLGSDASVTRAAQLAGVDADRARSLSTALTDAAVLAAGEPLHFVHPIARSAIYEDIPAGERRLLHARAARLLAVEGAESEVVATHLLACDPDDEAATLAALREAADAALARGAPEAAARYLRRALLEDFPVDARADVLHRLGEAECRSGDVGGIRRLQEAVDTASDPTHRGEIALALSQPLVHEGRLDEAGAVLNAAIAEQPASERELLLALESRLAWIAALSPTTYHLYGGRLSRVVEDVAGRTSAERGVISNLALRQTIEGGTATEAASLAARALGGDAPGGELSMTSVAEPILALIASEEFALAERHLEALLTKARAAGSLADSMVALVFRSILEYRRGQVLQAEDDARGVIEATWLGAPNNAAGAYLIHALIERNELDDAQDVLQGLGAVGDLPPNVMSTRLLLARAQLELARGEIALGVADLRHLADLAKGWVDRDPANFPYRSMLALAAGTERDEARALAAEELELARTWGSPRPIGVALRALGLVAGGEEGIELLKEAASVLEGSEARLEHARALVDLGAALRRSGSKGAAREHLAEGMALAHGCGATALVGRAHEELLAAGARPRRIALTGAASLTPSERRVARLAADGMTNKEIAQALFVTLRTVEMHLSNAYGKLAIRSRHDLPGALGPS